MKTVYKYPVPKMRGVYSLLLPKNSEFKSCQLQGDELALWAVVDPDEQEAETRKIFVAFTGESFTFPKVNFIGTVQTPAGIVLHIFEIIEY